MQHAQLLTSWRPRPSDHPETRPGRALRERIGSRQFTVGGIADNAVCEWCPGCDVVHIPERWVADLGFREREIYLGPA